MLIDEDKQSAIDRILRNFGPKPLLIITVRRVEPKWCAKYLGTVYVQPGDFNIYEIIRSRYGGHRFRLQIKDSNGRYLAHRTISICAEPLDNGIPIAE